MLGSIVSGYDSDSGSDSEAGPAVPTPPPPSALKAPSVISKLGLPPPSASKSTSHSGQSSGLLSSLPPPSSSAPPKESSKRKHQIRIEALSGGGDGADDQVGQKKRHASSNGKGSPDPPKMGGLRSSAGPSLSLFGMLPAPSRKGPPTPPHKRSKAGAEDDDGGGVGEVPIIIQESEDDRQSKKRKGNADFRAMLGLKPSDKDTSRSDKPAQAPRLSVPPATTLPLPKRAAKPEQASAAIPAKKESAVKQSPVTISNAHPAVGKPPASEPEIVDFFSIGTPPSQSQTSSAATSTQAKLARISAAPSIREDDSASPYPGWQQNPDGTWVPVTPEAQEAFARHQREEKARGIGAVDSRAELERLRAQGIDVDALQNVDLQATTDDWEKRPIEARLGAKPGSTSSSSSLDAKYAAAAGQIGDKEETADPHGRKKDKAGGFRAKQKGQLSALFAQAAERRDELEEKWAQGKANRRMAAGRYGF